MGTPYLVKAILAGRTQAGKSTLASVLAGREPPEEYQPTIGIEIHRRNYEYRNEVFYIQFWDPAGQDLFRSVMQGIHRGATVHIYVFDKCSRESFTDIPYWRDVMHGEETDGKLSLLYGNDKRARREVRQEVSFEEAAVFARENGMIYLEGSVETEGRRGTVLKLIAEFYIYEFRKRAWGALNCYCA